MWMKGNKMDPPYRTQFRQVDFFLFILGRNSSILPVLIASIMSNEREWIEHTLSHAHHEPRGGAVVFTRWLRYDSRRSSLNHRRPLYPHSLVQPFLFSFLHSLSPLPSPFSHCHSANDDGRRGRGALREEEADITKAISRMAHSMRACRVCGQSAIAILRCVFYDSERGCVSGRFNVERIPRKHLYERVSIPSLGLTRRQISEELSSRIEISARTSDHPSCALVRQE